MKKNKGFTLIELLAVIVILGILLSISTIAVNNIRRKQEVENKRNVISSILTGAKRYVTENPNSSNEISVGELLNGNYVDFDQGDYSDLVDLSVQYSECGGKLKRKFEITVEGTTYNDCGCEEQAGGSASSELCTTE